MSRVAVVILNFNAEEKTLECLRALAHQTYPHITPIIVDNNSSRTSALETYASDNEIKLIKNSQNKGFAGGVNTGISYALQRDFDYIALLNNDAVPAPDWIEKLIDGVDASGADIVTGLMLRSDGKTIDSTGEQYSSWGLPFPRDRDQPTNGAPTPSFVFGATGGGTLYRSSVFSTIGLFDETFFAYYEDVDISFRAQLANFKIFYTDKAILYHEEGGTFNKYPKVRTVQHFKNLPLLYIKNVPTSMLASVGFRFFIAYNAMLAKAIVHGAGISAVKGWLRQIPLFWFHAVPARIKIQREKKVPASYIRSILWPDLPPDQTGLRKFRSLFTGRK